MKSSLSVECFNYGSLKLIGQFCRDVIGCKTQLAFVSSDWLVFVCEVPRTLGVTKIQDRK